MRLWFRVLITLFTLSCSAAAEGQAIQISLPEHGDYRPGWFMPVELRVDSTGSDVTVTLRAHGAIPTTVAMAGRSRTVVPMLMLRADARQIEWSVDSNPKSAGSIAIQASDEGSDSAREVAGPHSALAGVDAYAPTFAWHPGAPARVRRTTMLSAMLVCVAMIAAVVLIRRRRLQLIAVVAVVVLSTLGIETWRRQISPIWRAGGQVVVRGDDGATQVDTWQYLTARSPADASVELAELTFPVFSDEAQVNELDPSLHFNAATSMLMLRCKVRPGVTLAVCSRKFISGAPDSATRHSTSTLRSPMAPLAQRLYRDSKISIVGEGEVAWSDDQTVRWPSIILRRRSGDGNE